MQKQKQKFSKRLIVSLLGIVFAATTFGLNIAFANCASPLVEAVDTKQCVDPSNTAKVHICPDNGSYYYLNDKTKCPAKDAEAESKAAQEVFQRIITALLAFEKFLTKIIWPVLVMIGGLMGNDLLFGSGMEQRLYDIWVPIRNIVNILFVIALVGIALYSVLGVSSEGNNYSIKTMLPKLIIGIIAVNFSFLGVKVFLDATNVLTTAVFALPNQTTQGLMKPILTNSDASIVEQLCLRLSSAKTKEEIISAQNLVAYKLAANELKIGGEVNVKTVEAAIKSLKEGKEQDTFKRVQGEVAAKNFCEVKDGSIQLASYGQQFFSKYRSNNAALAMALNMGNILFSDKPSSLAKSTLESMTIDIIFSTALNLIYMASFVTMFLVLLARLVVMWVGLAFSPVMALGLTVPAVNEKLKLSELTTKFVTHAVAPIQIALFMTVGWIMLNAMQGSLGKGSDSVLNTPIAGIPVPGLETLQGLIVCIATVAVVWMGVNKAATGTLVEGAVKGISDKLGKFGSFLVTSPIKYLPWVPIELKGEHGEVKRFTPESILYAGERALEDAQLGKKEALLREIDPRYRQTGVESVNKNSNYEHLAEVARGADAAKMQAIATRLKGEGRSGDLYKALEKLRMDPDQRKREFAEIAIAMMTNGKAPTGEKAKKFTDGAELIASQAAKPAEPAAKPTASTGAEPDSADKAHKLGVNHPFSRMLTTATGSTNLDATIKDPNKREVVDKTLQVSNNIDRLKGLKKEQVTAEALQESIQGLHDLIKDKAKAKAILTDAIKDKTAREEVGRIFETAWDALENPPTGSPAPAGGAH